MESGLYLLAIIVILALLFDYINGFHDAANAIATVVSTKALSPRKAVMFGAVLNFGGALLGTEVAATIGKGLVHAEAITLGVIIYALVGAILWNLLTWYFGLPSSSSHALIGSLLGATFFSGVESGKGGWHNIEWHAVMNKVVIPMFTSPVIGLTMGFVIMGILMWATHKIHLYWINRVFSKLQLVSSGFLAVSHGHNDAQKSMGIIALAFMIAYNIPASEFHVPLWVKVACAVMMGAGTLTGGWRIIRTLSTKMIRFQPVYGFAAEATSATIIMSASHIGIPLSTTQVISSSIMGVGATKRLSAVKWNVVGNILWAWVLTIPVTFFFSGMLTAICSRIF